MSEDIVSVSRPRVKRVAKSGVSALAVTRAKRSLVLSALALLGSSASLYFNEAFVAFCGL